VKNRPTTLALAIGLSMVAPTSMIVQPAYAQATKAVASVTVRNQTTVTVLSSSSPTVRTMVQNNTVTKTLADGSVVRETTPITYTITTTPQTIRTDVYQITTTVFTDRTRSESQRLVASQTSQRLLQSQAGVKGLPVTQVVKAPISTTAPIPAMPASTVRFDAGSYYNNPSMGTPTAVPSNDPGFYRTPEFANKATNLVRADVAYSRGWTGLGSTVLIMDTGVNTAHPDLAGKIKYSQDFTKTNINDTHGHGTHVAGIVAARRDGKGMHGVAFDANLAIAKIGTNSNINIGAASAAMAWASQFPDVVVANLSANVVYQKAYTDASREVTRGMWINTHQHYGGANYYNKETPQGMRIPTNMVLTVSAGNSNLGYVQNPATFAVATGANGDLVHGGRMLVVGNWNAGLGMVEGARAGHMCKDFRDNVCRDRYRMSDFYILAPGSGVLSTNRDGGYSVMSGTSQAAPVVAGAVAIINQLWPYMTPANQVQLLLKTADRNLPGYDVNVHGQGLLDLDRATQPVGGLGISTTGRTGAAAPVSALSVPGGAAVVAGQVSSVSAVDSFQRDFQVDLSPAVGTTRLITDASMLVHEPGQSWSQRLAGVYSQQFQGYSLGQMDQNTTVSFDSRMISPGDPTRHQFTVTRTDRNPWISYAGAWGTINYATTLEYNYLHQGRDGIWFQGGAMQTTTDVAAGMVQNIAPIYAVHGAVGYQHQGFNVYAGLQPYVIAGHMDLKVPTRTDAQGVMHYQHSSVNIRNDSAVAYAGLNWQGSVDRTTAVGVSAVANQLGDHQIRANYSKKF